MLILGNESICSTLASEVRADTTQRFKLMKQLPTDAPSHVKALNKLEQKAGDKGIVTLPDQIEHDTELIWFASRVKNDEIHTKRLTH